MTDGNNIEVRRCGQDVLLTLRLRRILRYLLDHQCEVERPKQLTLQFDCSGTSVRVRRTEHVDQLPE